MEATIIQKAMMDDVSRHLTLFNDSEQIPLHIQARIAQYDTILQRDGLKLKVTRYDDGIGKGWVIQLAAL